MNRPATVAQEHAHNAGRADYSLAFELAEYAAAEEVEDVDLMTTAERQALNAEMARWYGIE